MAVARGAGKTTLLRLIAGLEEPTSGQVLFDGEDITALGVQQRDLGFVFQVREPSDAGWEARG